MAIYNVREDWEDSLMWCPSQCYKRIEYKGRYFVIYLCWRHQDPWTASIIECKDEKFDLDNSLGWHDLEVKNWADTELDKLKKNAESIAEKWLAKNI